jgi:hypothetical protein
MRIVFSCDPDAGAGKDASAGFCAAVAAETAEAGSLTV